MYVCERERGCVCEREIGGACEREWGVCLREG